MHCLRVVEQRDLNGQKGVLRQSLSLSSSSTDGIMPNSNTVSFSTVVVINAWSNTSDPECSLKAKAIFDRLVHLLNDCNLHLKVHLTLQACNKGKEGSWR